MELSQSAERHLMSDAISKSDEGFVVFSHVPQTGGTSITAILMQFLTACGVTAEQMLLYGTAIPDTNLAPLDKLPGRVRFVAGHFRGFHYEKLLPHRPFVLVSIRDPFASFCSGLEHFARLRCTGITELHGFDRTNQLLEGLTQSRGSRQGTCEALRRCQQRIEIPEGLRNMLLYRDEAVADAVIDSAEIKQLCQMLATQTPKIVIDFETLEGVSHQNVWPRVFFDRFTRSELDVLQESFEDCFGSTIELVRAVREKTPSLFSPECWPSFCKHLCHEQAVASPANGACR